MTKSKDSVDKRLISLYKVTKAQQQGISNLSTMLHDNSIEDLHLHETLQISQPNQSTTNNLTTITDLPIIG